MHNINNKIIIYTSTIYSYLTYYLGNNKSKKKYLYKITKVRLRHLAEVKNQTTFYFV